MRIALPSTVALLRRPHSLLVPALFALVLLYAQLPEYHAAFGTVGTGVSLIGFWFVGRNTDRATAKLERMNMVLCVILFLWMVTQ